MLNWLCVYSVKPRASDTFFATLIESDTRAALQRLKKDDPVWSRGAKLVSAKPVMKPRTPWGGIEFLWFGRPIY